MSGDTYTNSLSRDRYVPKAYAKGAGWGVWDRLENRYVPDEELADIGLDRLKNEQLPAEKLI